MNLTALTHPDLITLQTTFTCRDDAINMMAQQLDAHGKLHNREQFLAEVFAREAQGPTALGEGLAVPHGKTNAVKEAAFAAATLKTPVEWEGIDGPESVEMIFLLAIPEGEAGSTHMQLLTALTSALVDDDVRKKVMLAKSVDEFMSLLNREPESVAVREDDSRPTVVCVTACPAGIAHTYMAAEYLEKAGRKLGINVYVEKQGANGVEGRLTAHQINQAQACVFATEVAIKEAERFKGIPSITTPVAEPIKHAERLLQ